MLGARQRQASPRRVFQLALPARAGSPLGAFLVAADRLAFEGRSAPARGCMGARCAV